MANTPRLDLPQPTGTDLISQGDNVITSGNAILDDAVMYEEGTFAGRPPASDLDGKVYVATDVGIVYLSDGTDWIELSRGGGTIPIGGMLDFAGSGDPTDTRFMLADGRAISRATYATLFALIGTTYGPGNGTTTFAIPDARGRSTVGPDNMGTAQGAAGRLTANNTRGASGGQEKSTIDTTNLPAHTHSVGTLDMSVLGAHIHSPGTLAVDSGGSHSHGVGTIAVAGSGTLTTGTQSASHTHSGTTGTADPSGNNITGLFTFNAGTTPNPEDYAVVGQVSDSHNHSFTTGTQSASHTHDLASHTHTLSGSTAAAGTHVHTLSGATAATGDHKHILSGATASTGSGSALNTMNPYVVVNKIIRVI